MNVYEEKEYPWLKEEKIFIREAIDAGKKVLGICLGAQLIADALGSRIIKNEHKEIGWFPVIKSQGDLPEMFNVFPEEISVFHWHGDTFDLPDGADRIVENLCCQNQAFSFNDGKVVGFQFHMEMTQAGIKRIMEQCKEDMTEGRYLQCEEEIMSGFRHVDVANSVMGKLLDHF